MKAPPRQDELRVQRPRPRPSVASARPHEGGVGVMAAGGIDLGPGGPLYTVRPSCMGNYCSTMTHTGPAPAEQHRLTSTGHHALLGGVHTYLVQVTEHRYNYERNNISTRQEYGNDDKFNDE